MRRAILGFFAAWGLTLSGFAATLTVDLNGGADYTDIQSAIDAAEHGDTVLVKPGEYLIDAPIVFRGKRITVKAEGSATQTVMRIPSPAIPLRASVVIFDSGETQESKLEGFVLTGGKGTGEANYQMGGAILCQQGTSPQIIKCTLRGNRAWAGGGICCRGASPTLVECVLNTNTSTGGGAIFCGGGSTVTAERCTLSSNQSTLDGGGVVCNGGSTLTLTECRISANSANWGGGIKVYGATVKAERSLVERNTSSGSGAGISCDEGGTLLLTNCVVAYNSTENGAGGFYVGAESKAELLHCTIARNAAGSFAPAIYLVQSRMTVTSSIVWHHSGPSIVLGGGAPPEVSYSCLQGGSIGEGNIGEDPLFASLSDFHLLPDSPAIDAATPDGAPAIDMEGNPRPCGQGHDMGAYELCPPSPPDCNGNGIDDAIDIAGGASEDCNANGIPDECDISSGVSRDVNSNGVPDSCEPDCNSSGVPDAYEVAQGTVEDCNQNGIPDSCDIAGGSSRDLDGDGRPDECGGVQRPGDVNGDATTDMSDAVWLLGHLFLGMPGQENLPCEGGTASAPGSGDLALADFNGDGAIDVSDPVGVLRFLFLGAAPSVLGTDCVRIAGCPDNAECR